MQTKHLFIALIFITSIAIAQDTACLGYEPKVEKVLGILERDTFPGPPNYESLKSGDTAEVYWILKLNKPLCINGIANDDVDVTETDIHEMQLVLETSQYKKYTKLIGRKVMVTGTLFHSATIHHKTSVLITVTDISPR